MNQHRALISTIKPVDGGVPTMTQFIIDLLIDAQIEPIISWYAPWSSHPNISVPIHSSFCGRKPAEVKLKAYGNHEGHALGAWFPELEFTHYLPREPWRELISRCSLLLAVTGNPLCATPYAKLGLPFMAWVATPWQEDRKDRVKSFSMPRRLLDNNINSPILRKLERQILQAPKGKILALSNYTAKSLSNIANRQMDGVMVMPVDINVFHPYQNQVRPWRIAFAGRYGDPRKRIELLLKTVSILANQGKPVELYLAGEKNIDLLAPMLKPLGIYEHVHCKGLLNQNDLAKMLQSIDIFVIPSHQEGLCIAAIEAMACGVPVVSTRCGGPEDYVIPGKTGQLVEANPIAIADTISEICANRQLRELLGQGALKWTQQNASYESAKKSVFLQLAALESLRFT